VIVEQLRAQRVLPVLRLPNATEATRAAVAMFAAGLGLVELTATTPQWEDALRDSLSAAPADACIGMGTVTDADLADRAIQAGARFLVSPWPAPDVRAVAQEADVLFMEGAFTPGEVADGVRRGPTKLFPAHVGGTTYLRSLLAVLPGATIVPTGGIALGEIPDWLGAGAAAVGVGSDLLKPGASDRLQQLLAAFDETRVAS
jgi:2-dehydro-3-deoxyphosphogluconate aldolase / (4S)-4-hydroxy-2-oxoglutarate aldolase